MKTTNNKATITVKFLKEAKYETNMFKIVEINVNHKLLDRFIKEYDGTRLIYLKHKYMNLEKTPLENNKFYKVQLSFEQFINNEEKEIIFINKIRHKQVKYVEKVYDFSSDEDY